jgi:hypothetical protein
MNKILYPDKRFREERVKFLETQLRALGDEYSKLLHSINLLNFEIQLLRGMDNLEKLERGEISFEQGGETK